MKALILNSGVGSRMGVLTSEHPKCMTEIAGTETILSRQLRMLSERSISDIVITTGLFDGVLVNYCRSLELPLHFTFVNNPAFKETNYIYSIYCARAYLKDDDVLLMHGDLVFEDSVLDDVLASRQSCMTVSSTAELPQKDFKAEIRDGKIVNVGVEFFNSAQAAQPLYKLMKADWLESVSYTHLRSERSDFQAGGKGEPDQSLLHRPQEADHAVHEAGGGRRRYDDERSGELPLQAQLHEKGH